MLFLHGRFTLSTDVKATKISHLRANPACSAVYMEADRIAVAVNGTVEWITREHIDHDEIHAVWKEQYNSDPYTWGDAILIRIAPISMWAYAFHPRTSRAEAGSREDGIPPRFLWPIDDQTVASRIWVVLGSS